MHVYVDMTEIFVERTAVFYSRYGYMGIEMDIVGRNRTL